MDRFGEFQPLARALGGSLAVIGALIMLVAVPYREVTRRRFLAGSWATAECRPYRVRGIGIHHGYVVLCPMTGDQAVHDAPHGTHHDLSLRHLPDGLSHAGDVVQIFDTGASVRLLVSGQQRIWVTKT